MGVAHTASVADAVKEFEDMDGDFSPAADLVAQWRGAGAAIRVIEVGDATRQVGERSRQPAAFVADLGISGQHPTLSNQSARIYCLPILLPKPPALQPAVHPFPTMTIEQLKELKDKLAVLRRYL